MTISLEAVLGEGFHGDVLFHGFHHCSQLFHPKNDSPSMISRVWAPPPHNAGGVLEGVVPCELSGYRGHRLRYRNPFQPSRLLGFR